MKKIILAAFIICLTSSCDIIEFFKGFKEGFDAGVEAMGSADRVINGFGEETNAYLTQFESDTVKLNDDVLSYKIEFGNIRKEIKCNPSLYLTFIKHGTLMLDALCFGHECVIHIDPVSMFGTDYTKMPKADIILVTHEHGDHLDTAAISAISTPNTLIYSNNRVAEITGKSKGLVVGDTITNESVRIIPVLAYNTTEGHTQFHPKGRDLGFIIEIDKRNRIEKRETKGKYLRIYVSGDTEPIEEMKNLGDIDIAFLPVNQPYTMTPEQAIQAIETIKPKVVYPYHYGETDLTPIIEHFKDNPEIDVRIRQLQ